MLVIGTLETFMNKIVFVSFVLFCFNASSQSSIRYKSSENKTSFEADGYYFSTSPIKIGTFNFGWLSIFTQFANSNIGQIRLTRNGKWKDINAYSFKVSRDTTYFHFKDNSFGTVLVTGRFTGSNGPAVDLVKEQKTVAFKGKIIVNGVALPIDLTWWEGD